MSAESIPETDWVASRLGELNSAQLEAATFGDGPLLIVAGAGTGKTRTIAARVACLVEGGVAPERILLLTFTRRAAGEMLRRAEALLGDRRGFGAPGGGAGTSKIWGGTFHSVAHRLLRMYGRAVGLPESFSVMDQNDAADLLHMVRQELGMARGDRRFPRKQTLLAIYSRTVNAQEALDDVLDRQFPWCREDRDAIALIFDGYVARKKSQALLDYDDLLLFWRALCETPGAGEAVADRFDHVLVDEYQDTNIVQADILRAMRRRNGNICVVGDDAQAIYSFRAATIRNILDFSVHFPGATMVTLEENYRSTSLILDACNAVMAEARERHTKNLRTRRSTSVRPGLLTCRDESHQTEAVCTQILEHRESGVALMKQAVLFRAGHHSHALEVELKRRNIPFHKYGGLKFFEAAHIKDMLAFLRVLENPYDEIAWFRVLLMLEGVGGRTAQRVMDHLGVRRGATERERPPVGATSISTPLKRLLTAPPDVPSAARVDFERFRELLAACCGTVAGKHSIDETRTPEAHGAPPALTVQLELIHDYYSPICRRIHENSKPRLRDIEQLAVLARPYRSRARFVADLTLDPPSSTADLAGPPHRDDDYLILSTIHSAKGGEWDVVYVIHVADGMIPSDMSTDDAASIDEERRLLYVAMTRARDALHLYFPLRYHYTRNRRGDEHGFAQLSRFLTPAVRATLDQQSVSTGMDDEAQREVSGSGRTPYCDVRRLWS
jgi:DNA helicase-2/ATP-dependent DNA helicase PcrA